MAERSHRVLEPNTYQKENPVLWKNIPLALALILAIAPAAAAQNVDDAIELGRSLAETGRQAVAAASLELSEAESAEFWPAYREYQSAIARVDDRFVDLIGDYARGFGSLTDEQAKSMAKDYFAIEKDRLSVRKKYFKKFRKIVGDKKAVRFLQVENKMDAIMRFGLAKEIPLMR